MTEERKEDGDLPVAFQPPRDGQKIYTTWPEMITHWPKTTLCIVSNEFCERFSYYGMKTVLTFYILNVLKFDAATSTIFFNSFTILCYLTPLIGSTIADGYIGKFWTIFFVSILYAIGQVILAIASLQDPTSSVHPWMDLAGLIIIGFGTGGIKPCVSAFGADQFEQGQERMISVYFSMFYFSINAGAMISAFITPIFRAQPCLGQDSCYPLCFGVPAILMIVAAVIFMAGSFWYKKNPPTENVFAQVIYIIAGAIRNKFSKRNAGPTDHWLEHYLDTHDCSTDPRCIALQGTKKKNKCQKKQYVADIRALLSVIVMFVPVPMFWALYDQQATNWLLQGVQMNCDVFGILILPDQMQALNNVLILVFIPLFQVAIYPLFSCCFKLTPLRKMIAGGFLAVLSFLITGFVQLQVNTTLPLLPAEGQAFASFMNIYDAGMNCTITVQPLMDNGPPPFILMANTSMVDIPDDDKSTFHLPTGNNTFTITYSGSDCKRKVMEEKYTLQMNGKTVYYIAVGEKGIISSISATDKPTEGNGEFSLGIAMFTDDRWDYNLAVCRTDSPLDAHPCNPQRPDDFYFWETDYNQHTDDRMNYLPVMDGTVDNKNPVTAYAYKPVKPGKWALFFMNDRPKDVGQLSPGPDGGPKLWSTASSTVYALSLLENREIVCAMKRPLREVNVTYSGVSFEINGQGGVYTFVITGSGSIEADNQLHVYQTVQDNRVNILWQVPQIAVITAAEILFSVTGYEFAYSQCAPSMKSVVQALWLLTTAFGDAIIVLITALNLFDDMAVWYFAFAGLMLVVIVIYALMAIFYYDYNYYTQLEEDEEEDEIDEIKEKDLGLINDVFGDELEMRVEGNAWEYEADSIDERM